MASTATTTQHTPTPWVYDEVTRQIWDAQKCTIVDMDYSDQLPDADVANAAFIVRACNSHEQLVAALKITTNDLAVAIEQAGKDPAADDRVKRARAALAAAGA
jgi:hypothetical protein